MRLCIGRHGFYDKFSLLFYDKERVACKRIRMIVSIITPCYRAELTIGQTIESVIGQTFADWEMIIVDDATDDGSARIIKEYCQKDDRIKYLRMNQPSGSPSMPRNFGIEHSRGELIAFLDADDVWLPDKLEKQVAFLKNNHYDLVYSYYEKMSWDGKRNERVIRTSDVTTYRSLLQSNTIPFLTSVIRRDALGDTRFKQIPQEDYCFWLDVLKKGVVAHNYREVLALYREMKDSRSSNKFYMFKGYWDVIRNHHRIGLLQCCYYMMTYSIKGFLKYIK